LRRRIGERLFEREVRAIGERRHRQPGGCENAVASTMRCVPPAARRSAMIFLMRTLEKLSIWNYKSIRQQSLELGKLNVFIGGNGSGKSNLISVFRFLREIVTRNLQTYTAVKGGADTLLHHGQKHSKSMAFKLEFSSGGTSNAYGIALAPTAEDSFTINSETAFYHDRASYPDKPFDLPIASAVMESKLGENQHVCAQQALQDLESYRVYHFHDTSDTAAVKKTADIDDNEFLRSQADNLAPFLYWMRQTQPDHYRNIVETVRQIAPFFDDFRLQPSRLNESKIRLEWRERGSDSYLNAHALSDGTLRFICLVTLLLQPTLPVLILLDEPELGLHPAAITLLADLLSAASERTQVMAATQSVTLVNRLQPEDVWAVDRGEGPTTFRHLSSSDMSQWLDSYALGELWEMNVLGARP
jgi:predicted ATPase